jgi:hypothetical protein
VPREPVGSLLAERDQPHQAGISYMKHGIQRGQRASPNAEGPIPRA